MESKKAGWVKVSDDIIEDILEMQNYFNAFFRIKWLFFLRSKKNPERSSEKHAETVMQLIEAKKRIRHLEKLLKETAKSSEYYT